MRMVAAVEEIRFWTTHHLFHFPRAHECQQR
jgi:hypothetical protein